MRGAIWRDRKVYVVLCYPHAEAGGLTMRAETLLIIIVCGLAFLAAPNMSVATPEMSAAAAPAPDIVASAADETNYRTLQDEADLALALLTQAQGRRIAMAQLAAK